MAIYKFRLLLEDHDDFFRDIEIKSNQTFEDFHKIIMESLGLDGKELASFFICDHNWRRDKEIALIDMTEDGNTIVMKNAVIANFIEDPHQRMIYVYDFLEMWTAYIELVKILPEEQKNTKYPRIIKSMGEPPKRKGDIISKVSVVGEPIFEEELIATDENDMDMNEEEVVFGELGESITDLGETSEESEESQL